MNDKSESPILIYEGADTAVEVRLDAGQEPVWLTQRQMGDVFGSTPENILMHLKNIYRDKELSEQATAKELLVVQTGGRRQVQRSIRHYNLDVIISVGYRVKVSPDT